MTDNDKPMDIDFDSLTMMELAEIEEVLGVSMESFSDSKSPKLRLIIAAVWVTMKRTNPDITFEEVGSRKITDMNLGDINYGDISGKAGKPYVNE